MTTLQKILGQFREKFVPPKSESLTMDTEGNFYLIGKAEDGYKLLTTAYNKGRAEGRKEAVTKVRRWTKLTHPLTYRVINLDTEPPTELKEKAVDKKALLFILKRVLKPPAASSKKGGKG